MKICLWVIASFLIPAKKTWIERLENIVNRDPKRAMFKTLKLNYILKRLKKAGVNGLELLIPNHISNKDLGKIKRITEKYSLPVSSIHQSLNSITDISLFEIENLCKIAHSFSAKTVTLHINVLGKRIFDSNFIEKLKKLQKEYEIIFGIENMPKTPFAFRKTHFFKGEDFSSVVKKTKLKMVFDTTHLAQVGEDICEFYSQNKENIINIHLSNYKKHWFNTHLLLQNDTHLPLGEGELPMAKFLKMLKKTNYQGIITMEINSDLKGLCASAQMIKKMAGE